MNYLILALVFLTATPNKQHGLKAAGQTPTSNTLTWQDSDTGVTFTMWRSTTGCTGNPMSFASIATGLTALTFTDVNLAPNTIYSYQVTAVRTVDGVSSAPSNCVTMTIPPPAAPTGLTITTN